MPSAFYLDLEDRLSKKLDKAEGNYGRFVKSLTKWNEKAYKTASKGLDQVAKSLEVLESIPKKAAVAYEKARTAMQKKAKPIEQEVKITFAPATTKQLAKAVGDALSKILRTAVIRMSPALPLKKHPFFDTSKSLRTTYKTQTQPPDLKGMFQNIPKFAEGGVVGGDFPGAKPGVDSVLAWLTPGEIVLPKDIALQIRNEKGRFVKMPRELLETLANIENLKKGIDEIQIGVDAGLGEKAMEEYSNAVELLRGEFKELDKITQKYDRHTLKHALQMLVDVRKDGMELLTESVEEQQEAVEEVSEGWRNLLEKVIGPARFLAITAALGHLQDGLRGITGTAHQALTELGGGEDAVRSFTEALFTANQTLRLPRAQLFDIGEQLVRDARSLFGGAVNPQQVGEAYASLVEAGMTNLAMLQETAPIVALLEQLTGQRGLALQVYKLRDAYNFSGDDIMAFYNGISILASKTATDTETLTGAVSKLLESGMLANVTDSKVATTMLGTMATLSASLSEHWVDGDLGARIAEGIADIEKQETILKLLSMSQADFKKLLQSGKADTIAQAIVDQVRAFVGAGDTQTLAQLSEALGSGMTPEELANIVKSGDSIVRVSGELQRVFDKTANTMDDTVDATKRMTSRFTQLRNTIGLFVTEKVGVQAIEFLEDFNFLAAASSVYLLRMAASATIAGASLAKNMTMGALSGIGNLAGLSRGAKAATAATQAAQVTSAGATAAGAAAGGGIGGFLMGLAKGLAAFAAPQVILGTAVVTAALSVLMLAAGAGLRIAGDSLDFIADAVGRVADAVADVAKTGLELMFGFLDRVVQNDPSALLMVGLGLAAFGIGFLAMAVSFASAGPLLLMAAPGLLAFMGAMALMEATGGTQAFSAAVETLAEMFRPMIGFIGSVAADFAGLDSGQIMRAALAVGAAALFVGSIALMVGAVAAVGAVSIIGAVGLLMGIPLMYAVADNATDIVWAVNRMTETFTRIDEKQALQAALGVGAAALFMGSFMLMTVSVAGVGLAALSGIIGLLMGVPLLAVVAQNASSIVGTLNSLSENFAGLNTEAMLDAGKGLAAGAVMIGGLMIATTAITAQGIQGSITRVFDHAREMFTGMLNLFGIGAEMTPAKVVGVMNEMLFAFSRINLGLARKVAERVGVFETAMSVVTMAERMGGKMERLAEVNWGKIRDSKDAMVEGLNLAGDVVKTMESEVISRILTRSEMRETVSVTIEGRVEASDERTHQLLEQLIATVSGGINNSPTKRPEAQFGARPPSDLTKQLAGQLNGLM